MTYIIDLQSLWTGNRSAEATNLLPSDPRMNVVSVIVVANNDEDKLNLTLRSALDQDYIREIIIVNNEVSPHFEGVLSQFAKSHPKCYVVSGRAKMGLAAAYNLGAQHSSGKFLLFLGSHCLLPKDAIFKLLTTGIHKPSPWVIGVDDPAFDPSQIRVSWRPRPMFRFWTRKSAQEENSLPEVSLPGGGMHAAKVAPHCLFLTAKTFLELKGMDRNCFHPTFHFDFCLRTHLAGGGGVYAAKNLDIVVQSPAQLPGWRVLQQKWQALRGWCYFYFKYLFK